MLLLLSVMMLVLAWFCVYEPSVLFATYLGYNKRYPEKDAVNAKKLDGAKEMVCFAEYQTSPP